MSEYGSPPPPPAAPPPGNGPTGPAPTSDAKGFFGALFDFSFSHFITPMIVRFVYILATIALVLGWLVWLIAAFSQSAGFGVVVLILGPILTLIWLAFIRMTLEFYLALVRMSEDIHRRLPSQ